MSLPLCAADFTLLYVGPRDGGTWLGLQQGMTEANVQGRFLDLKFQLSPATADEAKAAAGRTVVLAAGEPGEIVAIADALTASSVPVFNIRSRHDDLRPHCRPNFFHTAPSEQMLRDAEAQWKQKSESSAIAAYAWHKDFVKFAARELNNRFRKAHGKAMDDDAWAAWVAAKIVADAVANNPEATGEELIAYFREDMEFDGQKGDYVTFRETGQLRQPLLVVEDGELAGEAPVRGVAAAGDLDSLGAQSCR